MVTKKGNLQVHKRDKKKKYSPMFFGVGLFVCFMLLFVGTGVASATDYYVSVSGKNSDDGTTLDTAWQTIAYATAKAQAGDTVHIKGGNYGHEHVVIKNTGTATKPIVFEGYGGTPVINGKDETGYGIHIDSKDYITLRNIKVTQYNYGVYLDSANHIIMEDLKVTTCHGMGIFLYKSHHCILRGSDIIGTRVHNVWVKRSNYNLIENCTLLSDPTLSHGTGYYIIIGWSHDNIIRNCTVRNLNGHLPQSKHHPGHGIVIKDNPEESGTHSYNNKIINCEVYSIQECLVAAHHSHHNEFINCKAYKADLTSTSHHIGLIVRNGAHDNIFESCTADGFKYGIVLTNNAETPENPANYGNTFENGIITDSQNAIRISLGGNNNLIKNCVIDDTSRLFLDGTAPLKNCIVTNVGSRGNTGSSITYSNFWNNGFSMPSGTGNMNADPLFVDSANGDYHLQSDSPCKGAGKDANGNAVDMGAYPEDDSNDVGTISGAVTEGTNPIQGAAVTVNSYSDRTDSKGYYEISNVPVGTYTVTASVSGYYQESQANVQVSKDQTTTVNFQLSEAPDLVGNWQFDEGEGTTVHDSSVYGNDGTIKGADYTTNSKRGKSALLFDGVDDYVEIQDSASLAITDTVTVVAWIKPDTFDRQCSVLGKRDSYTFKTSGSEIKFTTPGKKDHTSTGAGLVTGSWQHVAVVFVADDMARFYKNGAFISSDSASTMSSSTYPLLIGNNQWNERFGGIIDEVTIYNRALSTEEIRTEYEAGFKIPNYDVNEDGLVDISDTTIVGQHRNETTNSPYPRYDVNEDGFVDDLDISIVDQHYGEITS